MHSVFVGAGAIHRRKEIWEVIHPETATNCRGSGGRGKTEFASETAAASGQNVRDVQRHVARADALGPDLHAVVGTSSAYAITHPNILEFEQRKARERQEASLKRGDSFPLPSAGGDGGRVSEKLAAKAGVGARRPLSIEFGEHLALLEDLADGLRR